FRDWAAECSDAPREVCELALAQVNTDRMEAAYRRTDLFERRRAFMEQWVAFVCGRGGSSPAVGLPAGV
ncbi:MAG: integrase, partial [Rhodospirillales bacterium]|nr:integrase [Rhodospirillales bacterium]